MAREKVKNGGCLAKHCSAVELIFDLFSIKSSKKKYEKKHAASALTKSFKKKPKLPLNTLTFLSVPCSHTGCKECGAVSFHFQ